MNTHLRTAGSVAMTAGAVGAFVTYQLSGGYDDGRDIASGQVLAVAFLALCVLGAGLYVASALTALMRAWLLGQVVESQDRDAELLAAVRDGRLKG